MGKRLFWTELFDVLRFGVFNGGGGFVFVNKREYQRIGNSGSGTIVDVTDSVAINATTI